MRIFVGLTEIAGLIPVFADGFRKIGHQVTTVVSSRKSLFSNEEYDVNLVQPLIEWPFLLDQKVLKAPSKIMARGAKGLRIASLMASHDVFVFQWSRRSLCAAHKDYPLLKKLGKKVVSVFLGSDTRYYPAYQQWYTIMGEYLNEVPFKKVKFSGLLYSLRMAEMYSDLILSVPNQSMLNLRPYDHLFIPVDVKDYPLHISGRDIPVVVHAPSKSEKKGTNYIIQALNQLKKDGIQFELHFIEGIPHHQLKDELMSADVVVDQLFFPLHGKLAVEAMASGCAVATGDSEDYEPFPPDRPIWYINPENIYHQLKTLLTDKDLRVKLALLGRKYVEKYYDHIKVSERILDRIDLPSTERRDHYPDFFVRDFCLDEKEIVPNNIKQMSTQIIQKWGLPADVDPQELVQKGLVSDDLSKFLTTIPRWQ